MSPSLSLSRAQVSSLSDGCLLVGASQYYGIVGNGALTVLDATQNYSARWSAAISAGVFACAGHAGCLPLAAAACADGTVQVFHCEGRETRPLRVWKEHSVEASCVSWSPLFRSSLVSGGWDGRVHLHSLQHPRALRCITMPQQAHAQSMVSTPKPAGRSACTSSRSGCSVHSVDWHPADACTLLTGDASGQCCIVDLRARAPLAWEVAWGSGAARPEVLAARWLWGGHAVAAGTSHGALLTFDIRQLRQPMSFHAAHSLGVRCMAVSPPGRGGRQLLATGSYDCSVRVWDAGPLLGGNAGATRSTAAGGIYTSVPSALQDASSALLAALTPHSEFVTDVHWLRAPIGKSGVATQLASVGWDEQVVLSRVCA